MQLSCEFRKFCLLLSEIVQQVFQKCEIIFFGILLADTVEKKKGLTGVLTKEGAAKRRVLFAHHPPCLFALKSRDFEVSRTAVWFPPWSQNSGPALHPLVPAGSSLGIWTWRRLLTGSPEGFGGSVSRLTKQHGHCFHNAWFRLCDLGPSQTKDDQWRSYLRSWL